MRRDERGSAVVTALLVGLVLAMLAGSLMRTSLADLAQTDRSQATDMALQAAEAGVNDYVAKLTEDRQYYAHWVHPAESTRSPAPGAPDANGNVAWNGTLTWTYPNGRDGGVDLGDGFSYSLQVFPPVADRTSVRIVATGWRTGDPGSAKTVEALVRAASIADFQMISNANITYGTTSETYGKIYAGNGANVTHKGVAHADVHAEGQIFGDGAAPVNYQDDAVGYDFSTIRSVIPTPIDFAKFTDSIGDVELAAATGIALPDNADDAWWLRFLADGQVEISTCPDVDLNVYGASVVDGQVVIPPIPPPPVCTLDRVEAVPANGAIYSEQDVIVSGVVNGRVTVATPSDIVVGDDLTYAQPGIDVLGLIGQSDVMVPFWAPLDLEWWSATLAIDNRWRSLSQFVAAEAQHQRIEFHGSTATFLGGYMNQYKVRDYNYDENLLYLQPPYFPVLEDAYTIELFREIE